MIHKDQVGYLLIDIFLEMAKYKILFFCPDHHISYDIRTLNNEGVGGGITARVRIAHALAKRGHDVTLYINCPEENVIDGVKYRHFSHYVNEETDLFVAGTSGGGLNLSVLNNLNIHSRKQILMIHGIEMPQNVDFDRFDCLYVPSNFLRIIVNEKWQVPSQKIFVTNHGVTDDYDLSNDGKNSDPYTLTYIGHPSKGLDTAICIFRILHRNDPRFNLHIFGGNKMWGGVDDEIPAEDGLVVHGLIGQKNLARELQKISFSLNLQSREEPFGMAVIESMRAGCIVLASPVGAYPELIYNGYNGFLISGNHSDQATREKAASTILELTQKSGYMKYIRSNAIKFPLSWHTVAETWESHWDWLFNREKMLGIMTTSTLGKYVLRNDRLLLLADGLHCIECGHYQPSVPNNNVHDHFIRVMMP